MLATNGDGSQTSSNPLFLQNIPYDKHTCDIMCESYFSLQRSDCYRSFDVWVLAGQPWNGKICDPNGLSPNLSQAQQCECFPSCNSYRFNIIGQQTIHHEMRQAKYSVLHMITTNFIFVPVLAKT